MAGLGHWYIEIEKQGYWRGVQHYWVNRYVMSGGDPSSSEAVSVIGALKSIEDALPTPTGAGAGVGFIEGRAYLSTGGAPFATVAYNADKAIATATGWGGFADYTTLSWTGTLENCLDIVTPLQGLSSRGKPVQLRKFFRGFFASGEDGSTTPISSADRTHIAGVVAPWQTGLGPYNRTVIGTSGRASSGPPTVQEWIGNHQVPRGRKRTSRATASALAGAVGFAQGSVQAAAAAAQAQQDNDGNTNINIGNGSFIPII